MMTKTMNPLVTIVIPIYKVEKFIERCLQSVVNQSYTNIECVLVNDVSPDDSMLIAEKFIQRNPDFNFVIFNQPCNLGLSMARNAGMDLAQGKYIYFLDSDDEITDYAIDHLVKLAEETNAEMVLGQSVCINEEENWRRNYFPINCNKDILLGSKEIVYNFAKGEYPVMACDKLVRMDFLMENKLYFVRDLFSQDVLWSFQSMLKFEKIAFLREDTYLYYFHGASIIHNRGEKHFGNWITIASYMDDAYKAEKNPYNKKLILENLIDFKATTLEMNWKAQHNKALWKSSYKAYNQFSGLSIGHYLSSAYSTRLKKKDLLYRLPFFLGYPFFRWRFAR